MHLLYPSNPLQTRQPDEQWATEVEAVRAAGFEVSFFSLEDFQSGDFRPRPLLPSATEVLYRGWMLSDTDYDALVKAISDSGAKSAIDLHAYLASHHLPNWYSRLADLTPETRVFPADCDLEAELRALHWPEYFVKDYVKSVKTSVGSRISKPEHVTAVISAMRRFRGVIEGGYCVRRVENFVPKTEQRYFVLDGQPYAMSGEPPEIARKCAERHKSRFYSVDVAQRADASAGLSKLEMAKFPI